MGNMDQHLQDLLRIIALTQKFQSIRRRVYVRDEGRMESDPEHSFQLAFIAWYLVNKHTLPLDSTKILHYALAHDIVEVHAGDIFFHRTKEEELEKTRKEAEALKLLKKEFPEFPELHATLVAYNARGDAESKFVYALDKLLPVINIYLDNGRSWHLNETTLQMIKNGKLEKIAIDPLLAKYFGEILTILEEHPELFFSKKTA